MCPYSHVSAEGTLLQQGEPRRVNPDLGLCGAPAAPPAPVPVGMDARESVIVPRRGYVARRRVVVGASAGPPAEEVRLGAAAAHLRRSVRIALEAAEDEAMARGRVEAALNEVDGALGILQGAMGGEDEQQDAVILISSDEEDLWS